MRRQELKSEGDQIKVQLYLKSMGLAKQMISMMHKVTPDIMPVQMLGIVVMLKVNKQRFLLSKLYQKRIEIINGVLESV